MRIRHIAVPTLVAIISAATASIIVNVNIANGRHVDSAIEYHSEDVRHNASGQRSISNEVDIHTNEAIVKTTKSNLYDLSDGELYQLSSLVYLEAGIESYECQKAVASVAINRMLDTDTSLSDVIFDTTQFTPADKVATTIPSKQCIAAVNDVVMNGITLPRYVTFFKAKEYHNWDPDRYIPYTSIDDTYFSYDIKLYEKYTRGNDDD